ncbi:MAG: WecB/TagA/CpsF family glycosyltransferase [Eubacteriales bacterium]
MRIDVLGVNFHQITMAEAVAEGKKWLSSTGFHAVVTPNPEFILLAQKNKAFCQCLNHADLVLPDGIGVIYAAKILGTPLQERVPGIEFSQGMLESLGETGGRLFLLGAKEGVAEKAGENIARDYPDLTICGTYHGYFTAEEEEEVAQKVAQAKADVIFVCLGAPRQELFCQKWGETMGVKVGIGLGGALDVYAGTVNRAPQFWISLNLEWFYRLMKEPKRLGRMVKLPLVLWQAFWQRGKKPKNKS